MSREFSGDERRQKDRAAEAFEQARDRLAHDCLHVSEEARARIGEVQALGRKERAAMREEQALNWEQDVIEEKANLLRQKASLHHRPGEGFTGKTSKKRESDEALTRRAEDNVAQNNEHALARTYPVEIKLIADIVLDDLREFDRTHVVNEEMPARSTDRQTPSQDKELVRATFTRASERDDGGREM